jgi:hypothetical protein
MHLGFGIPFFLSLCESVLRLLSAIVNHCSLSAVCLIFQRQKLGAILFAVGRSAGFRTCLRAVAIAVLNCICISPTETSLSVVKKNKHLLRYVLLF